MQGAYAQDWFEETGALYPVRFSILKNKVLILLDTSGVGLHKRGYRTYDVAAPIKETLASALVSLSFFRPEKLMVDPMCGSGTIAIEAAMIGKNIAPGLNRGFAAEHWDAIPKQLWREERKAAFDSIKQDVNLKIIASDIDKSAIEAARANASKAGG